jgi:hypothetical protein
MKKTGTTISRFSALMAAVIIFAVSGTVFAAPSISAHTVTGQVLDDPWPAKRIPASIAGATVYFKIPGGAPGSEGYVKYDSTTSDANGYYAFTTVTYSNFRLTFSSKGFRQVSSTFANVSRDTATLSYMVATDAYATVTGRACLENLTNPAPVCTVDLVVRLTDNGTVSPTIVTTVSGDDGSFTFDSLPVPANHFPILVRLRGMTGSKVMVDTAALIRSSVFVYLYADGAPVHTVSGMVVDDPYPMKRMSLPIPGATVYCAVQDERPLAGSDGFPKVYDSTTTDANGSFVFPSVPYSTFRLKCRAKGFREVRRTIEKVNGDTSTAFTMIADNVYAAITGHVYRGNTMDPFPGCTVSVMVFPDLGPMSPMVIRTVSDNEGSFTLDSIPVAANYYPVHLSLPGMTGLKVQVDTVALIRTTITVDLYADGSEIARSKGLADHGSSRDGLTLDRQGGMTLSLRSGRSITIILTGLDGRVRSTLMKNRYCTMGDHVFDLNNCFGEINGPAILTVTGENVFLTKMFINLRR